VPERGNQHRGRQVIRLSESMAMPPVGVPVLQARCCRCVQQRKQCGDGPAGGHAVTRVAGVEVDAYQNGA
jgi:hypothetical protein